MNKAEILGLAERVEAMGMRYAREFDNRSGGSAWIELASNSLTTAAALRAIASTMEDDRG